MSVAVWYIKGDSSPGFGESKKFGGLVVTSGPTILPDVKKALPKEQMLEAIRNISLLVEIDKNDLDFMSNQV